MIEIIAALILTLTGCSENSKARYCEHVRQPRALASMIVAEFGEADAVIATRIMYRESGFNPKAVGPMGSVGYMQINPRGVATFRCKKLPYATEPRANLQCGKRVIAHYRKICATDDPRLWLSPYKGWRYCRESAYSRKVLGLSLSLRQPQKSAQLWSPHRGPSRARTHVVPTKTEFQAE